MDFSIGGYSLRNRMKKYFFNILPWVSIVSIVLFSHCTVLLGCGEISYHKSHHANCHGTVATSNQKSHPFDFPNQDCPHCILSQFLVSSTHTDWVGLKFILSYFIPSFQFISNLSGLIPSSPSYQIYNFHLYISSSSPLHTNLRLRI